MPDQQATISTGTSGATLTLGTNGATVTVNPTQAATITTTGSRGQDGHTPHLWSQAGPPVTTHTDGDLYLDTANGDLYQQQTGTWALTGNLAGPGGSVTTVNGHTGAVTLTAADVGATPLPTTFTQAVGNTVWTIHHTLPYRPAVDIYDNNGDLVWADLDYPDTTTVTVTFAFAATGSAVLR